MKKVYSILKYYWVIILPFKYNPLHAQHQGLKMDIVTIDSAYSSDLFDSDKDVTLVFHKINKNIQTINGQQSVSTTTASGDTTVIKYLKNSRVKDSTGVHYPFDNCISYFNRDTLVIEFRHHFYETNVFGYHDRIILRLIKNRFFSTYVWAKPPANYKVNPSYSSLILKDQQLILKKPVTKIGDRLMGQIKVQFYNNNSKAKARVLSFSGPFDCIIK